MLRFLWPMKAPNDEAFRTSNKQRTIYDDVVADMPEFCYDMELGKYNELRWRKGFIHNVVPPVMYGTILGAAWGLNESRRGLVRHTTRPRIIFGNILVGSGLALCTSATHHGLLMASDYRAAVWQPIVAGVAGGAIFSALHEGLQLARGAGRGFMLGLVYTVCCIAAQKYNERALTQFFVTQQQQETPLHKVAPELQRLYRAWLFDHRPLEDWDKARRETLILDRDAADTRLDGSTFIKAATIDAFEFGFEFPEWWPLKLRAKSEDAQIIEKRMRDDGFERRKLALLENQIMLSHPLRAQTGRDLSDRGLDMPSDRS